MPPYPVLCSHADCGRPAAFKIAARWSDGITEELKTYALACADCVAAAHTAARARQAACRLSPGEALDPPGVYELHRGVRDAQLPRRPDCETAGPENGTTPASRGGTGVG